MALAGIAVACAIVFKIGGRGWQLALATLVWATISVVAISVFPRPPSGNTARAAWALGYAIAIAIAVAPLWFCSRDTSVTKMIASVAPVAFAAGYLGLHIQWLTLCFVSGSCDP